MFQGPDTDFAMAILYTDKRAFTAWCPYLSILFLMPFLVRNDIQSWFHSQQLQTYVYLTLEISLLKIMQGYMARFIVSQHAHLSSMTVHTALH